MNLIDSTQFIVKEVSIQTKGGALNITDLIEEIHLYDNLFLPVSSGEVLITDAAKLQERVSPNGDPIQFYITKTPNDDFASFVKIFRIYHISTRKNVNNTSESYIIHFVSDELIYSEQKKLSFGFDGKYSDLVRKILTDSRIGFGLDTKKISEIEPTNGIRKITVPNLPPLDALEWCAKRAINDKNVPDYVFYSNIAGYNFSSLSRLLSKNPILDITFTPKNLDTGEAILEMGRARGFEIVSQEDTITKIKSGVDAGVFIGFDPLTRSIGEKTINGDDTFASMSHANKNATGTEIINRDRTSVKDNYQGNQVLSSNQANRKNSNYVKKNDPSSISKEETQELFLQQRKAILTRLMERRMRIVMPGNFQLSSGFMVNVISPGFGAAAKTDEKDFDKTISGKYIIVGTRHILSLRRHVTVIEVATDSTNETQKYSTTQSQESALKAYDKITRAG
jgi:hypothetical protein